MYIAGGKDANTFLYTIQRKIHPEKGDPKDIKFICTNMSVPFKLRQRKSSPK
ncbi:hypothetical protein X924_08255 [Petrotoga sp. 9PWA.NaAc.5.4]|nr:hypothetical protein X924_08255 [Petrotoga sp. 9PWA.NaAc.5.4]